MAGFKAMLWRALVALPVPLLAMTPPLAPMRAKAATPRSEVSTSRTRKAAGPALLAHVSQRLRHDSRLLVVAFGSSSTQGIGASNPQATYPSRLQAELAALLPHEQVSVINRGIGGEDAEDLSRRLGAVLADHPDLVIFQTGTNDPLRGIALDRFLDLTRDNVATLQRAGIDVMLMEPQLCHVTRTTPESIRFRDAVRQVGDEMRVPVIRRWDLMQGWLDHDLLDAAQMLAPDGLHMADAGYAMLAHEVARQIMASAAPSSDTTGSAGVNSTGVNSTSATSAGRARALVPGGS